MELCFQPRPSDSKTGAFVTEGHLDVKTRCLSEQRLTMFDDITYRHHARKSVQFHLNLKVEVKSQSNKFFKFLNEGIL